MQRREAIFTMGVGSLALSQTLLGATAGNSPATAPADAIIGFEGGKFTLPPLPYDYNALEPHIDEQTLKLHHDKHHQAYVDGANKALAELEKLRGAENQDYVSHWEQSLAFNASGHILHTLFWNNMAPQTGEPSAELAAAIDKDFGGMEHFKTLMSNASRQVQGSGWGMLGYHPLSRSLMVLQIEKHQNHTVHGVIPLMVLDVWEHAYYLKYQNDRGAFIKAFWNVVNWPFVSGMYETAKKAVEGMA